MKSVRVPTIGKYGQTIAKRPGRRQSDTVIITAGRADVVNMLRHGYINIVRARTARGRSLTRSRTLSKKKTLIPSWTATGRRAHPPGAPQVADIDYIARAPPARRSRT
jgi:hypothetical protein